VLHLRNFGRYGLASDWISVLFHKRKKLLAHFTNDVMTKLHRTRANPHGIATEQNELAASLPVSIPLMPLSVLPI
jgi:hypothetical protein